MYLTTFSENKVKLTKFLEVSEKSEDATRSLQYKVPINSVAKDKAHSSREVSTKNAHTNVFSLRKHGNAMTFQVLDLRNAHQFDELDQPRDRTPLSKSIKTIDHPMKSE